MKRIRYTTYVSEKHLKILRELATEIQVPISFLIGNALDSYLRSLNRLSKPEFAPIDKEFLRLKPEERGILRSEDRAKIDEGNSRSGS